MSNEITATATYEVALFQPQNMQTMGETALDSYQRNNRSHDNAIARGQVLLQRVATEGMTDALDKELAEYIRLVGVTIKAMNGRRSPVTKMFDMVRKAYTAFENGIDPAKAGTVPYQIQQHRNAYARKKHEEEQRRQREEAARLAKETAKVRYRAEVEDDYVRQFNALVNKSVNDLTDMDKQLTLDNYDTILDGIRNFRCELPDTWCRTVTSGAHRPAELTPDECRAIQANVMAGLAGRFNEQFAFEVSGTRDDILDRMPSKKRELERIAKASAEEAARIKAEMEAKERAEAARKEAERLEREKQEAAASRLAADKQEMDGLFGMPVAATAAHQPKTQVKKKVVIETAEDIMKVVAFWMSRHGCTLSVGELAKEFKKQINFVNAAANSKDNPVFITDVRYEDEVKAK